MGESRIGFKGGEKRVCMVGTVRALQTASIPRQSSHGVGVRPVQWAL